MARSLRIGWSQGSLQPELREQLEMLVRRQLPPGWRRVTSSSKSWVAWSGQPDGLYFKGLPPRSPLDWLKALNGGRARRAVGNERLLRRHGFRTPATICWGQYRGFLFTVTRAVAGEPLTECLRRDWVVPLAGERLRAKRRLLVQLGQLIGRLHAAGICHGDLRLQNVLLAEDDFYLIDNEHNRRYRRLPVKVIEANLFQASLQPSNRVSRTDRLRVLHAYAQAYPRFSAGQLKQLALRVFSRTVAGLPPGWIYLSAEPGRFGETQR